MPPRRQTGAVIEHELKPLLIGQDPLKIEYLWQLMFGLSLCQPAGGVDFLASEIVEAILDGRRAEIARIVPGDAGHLGATDSDGPANWL
jgi:hypothetical protein